jgi:hypothetical protein
MKRWSERPSQWARWWIFMWGIIAASLLVSAFFVPFRAWAVAAAIGFGIPEGVALLHKGDRLPPLTYVSAFFLPRWLIVTLIGFFTGSIGATWLGFHRPFSLGCLLALFAWAISHFDVTYDEIPK